MDKSVLYDYVDACELVRETEADIRSLHKRQTVYDKVKGSNPDFPYQPQGFNISGIATISIDDDGLERERRALNARKANAKKIRIQAEEVLNDAPVRMQRIIRYKIFQGLTWDETAAKILNGCTGESLRKEFERFMLNK